VQCPRFTQQWQLASSHLKVKGAVPFAVVFDHGLPAAIIPNLILAEPDSVQLTASVVFKAQAR
jgi:hypothetical protein